MVKGTCCFVVVMWLFLIILFLFSFASCFFHQKILWLHKTMWKLEQNKTSSPTHFELFKSSPVSTGSIDRCFVLYFHEIFNALIKPRAIILIHMLPARFSMKADSLEALFEECARKNVENVLNTLCEKWTLLTFFLLHLPTATLM